MATLIPDPLPRNAHAGENNLARLLRGLPEDWTVYHEPRIGKYRPDFVILAPNFGVLVIEVKDWGMSTIQKLDHQQVELQGNSGSESVKAMNPLKQVDDYWRAVKDACQDCLFGQALLQREGNWRGHLCFPVGALVVFTRIREADVAASEHRAVWDATFTAENTVLADQFKDWQELDASALADALKPYFRPFEMRQRFSAHQIDVLRWVLFPESRMDVILGRAPADAAKAIEVLDAKQEQHARSLGSGHRILFGVAGSGKTVLLLARARWLAREYPERRTLLLCYNKVLAAWLRARMADCPSPTVLHFDGWAKELHLTRRMDTERDDAVFGARVLESLRQRGDAARVWDAVLIDEAQDFEPAWFQCALATMKDPENGDLVIVGDGSQRLYKRNRVSWKELGIKAAGRTISARYDLDKNYRNTPKIAALAAGYSDDERNEDGINGTRVDPNTCRRFNHSTPVFVTATDHAAQVDAALEIVRRWLQGERARRKASPLQPGEIGILYPTRTNNRSLLDRLIAGLSQLAPTRWLSRPQDTSAHLGVNEPAIKVQTIHSAKGLQYKAVLVLWTDLLPTGRADADDERHLLYVAITRAENDLVLLGSGGRGFSRGLAESCAVRQFPFTTASDTAAA